MKTLNLFKRTFCIVLIFVLIVTMLFTGRVSALNNSIGIVDSPLGLFVRTGAGTSYPQAGGLSNGDKVIILGSEMDEAGLKWYFIEAESGLRGYAASAYINISETESETQSGGQTVPQDMDFESYLSAQGFPESYKPYLRRLHSEFPSWTFTAKNTGLNWNEAVLRESKTGTSLVSASLPAYYKSNSADAFNSDGSYKSFDSGGWHAASTVAIKYYMDPRNFLTKSRIFQFLTHSFSPSDQTIDGLRSLVRGTFLEGEYPLSEGEIPLYMTYPEVIYSAGEISGVNPYVLASMILVEQGNSGVGGCISGNVPDYEGHFNYFNIGAYKSGGLSAVQRGLQYAMGKGSYERPWDTREKSIVGGAKWYYSNFVSRNKNTLYLKKWNVMNGLSSVGSGQYMSNIQGAYLEAANLYKGYTGVLSSPMNFEIPVYYGMPNEACHKPSESDIEEPSTSTDPPENEPSEEEIEQAEREAYEKKLARITDGVENTTIKASSLIYRYPSGKAGIRINWTKRKVDDVGYRVDYYEVFRSEKRNSGYTLEPIYTTKTSKKKYYINTKGLIKGKRYYFKVRGVRIVKDYDGNESLVYTKFSNPAYRTWR